MGIIKTIASAVGGSLADQWLEVIEPEDVYKRQPLFPVCRAPFRAF